MFLNEIFKKIWKFYNSAFLTIGIKCKENLIQCFHQVPQTAAKSPLFYPLKGKVVPQKNSHAFAHGDHKSKRMIIAAVFVIVKNWKNSKKPKCAPQVTE